MIYTIYCMKDAKTSFLNPTFEINEAVARRNFAFAINQVGSLLYANAEDFDLYELGKFDTESGSINTEIVPKFIVAGSAVKEVKNEL